ncbi:hypothetical protein SADUNF_Sadunf16G0098800 [Salix dunnii]|uniref:non-specific serine/threonine protein kinase n=2 Tax=rosids TaxID=71275 RepID=A0A835MLD0_9ROSI|nr:hypothetical protein SADUNF_Sadunf16G0098800 [Salix dunnii]
MGNCCRSPAAVAREDVKSSFSGHDHGKKDSTAKKTPQPIRVLTGVPKENIEERYLVDRELGRGEFGVTYLCIERDSRELLACKSISKRKLRTAVDIEDVRREVAIMKHLPKNSSIVSLKEACEDDNAVHLVMELCEGGELFDRIVARGHYTERAAAAVTRTIVEVVQLCHKHGVIHRDLKPENFLFANKKENSPLKAIDFGLSIFFKPGERFSEIVGSPYYMAPEVLKRNYGPEIDIWSAGVILYILLCGVPPFWAGNYTLGSRPSLVITLCVCVILVVGVREAAACSKRLLSIISEQGVAQAILRGIIDFKRDPWPNISESAKSLVRQMLEPDPKLRLTARQVIEHPWLQNAKKAPNVPLGDVVKSRLKQFSMMNRFKRKALRVIADFLSIEEVEDIKEMFKKMDTDNDGIVSIEELKTGLRNFGSQLAESEVQMLVEACHAFDTDDGVLLEYARGIGIAPIMRLHQVKFYDQLLNLSHISMISSPRDNFSSNLLCRLSCGEWVEEILLLDWCGSEFDYQLPIQVGTDMFCKGGGEGYRNLDDGYHRRKPIYFLAFLPLSFCLDELNNVGINVDTNEKGKLDYGEFVAVSLHLQRMANDEHIHKAFSYFDKDGNGYIEPDELRDALMEDGADDCTDVANDIFQEVDTDKDGRISYDEFVAMMKTGTDWRKASRHYSRGRFNSLSMKLMKDGSLNLGSE